MTDSTAPRDFIAEAVREHMSLRTAMLEKLCEAQFIEALLACGKRDAATLWWNWLRDCVTDDAFGVIERAIRDEKRRQEIV